MGSVKNLVRSLLVILALMAALVLVVPRVSSVGSPTVDVHPVAVDVAERTGWPVLEAVGLPKGWTGTSARYVRGTAGFSTWHAGYRTPDGTYVAVEQTMNPSKKWIEAQTNRAPRIGEVEAGGLTWVAYERDVKVQNSLLHTPANPATELTTLITGTASFEEMKAFAGYLKPAK